MCGPGDGVVPEMSPHLEGQRGHWTLALMESYHSLVGSDDTPRPWYGFPSVVEKWIHHLLGWKPVHRTLWKMLSGAIIFWTCIPYSWLCSSSSLSNHIWCFVSFPCSLHCQNSVERYEQPVTQEIRFRYLLQQGIGRFTWANGPLFYLNFFLFNSSFTHGQFTYAEFSIFHTNLLKQTSPLCIF